MKTFKRVILEAGNEFPDGPYLALRIDKQEVRRWRRAAWDGDGTAPASVTPMAVLDAIWATAMGHTKATAAAPVEEGKKTTTKKTKGNAVSVALARGANIREAIEDLDDVRGAGRTFLDDVYEKVGEVCETIERIQKVTDKQKSALDGWARGVAKFARD